MEKKALQLSEVDLDLENPRTGTARSQPEALQRLLKVELDGEKVFALALDICQIGMLDPGERLYVMPGAVAGGPMVALDGNRRIAALRLLSQAGLIDNPIIGLSPAMKTRFKKLQTEYPGKWPAEVDVVIFPDRRSAAHFIGLRHKGQGGGAGRSDWSALQIARFDNSGLWQAINHLRVTSSLTQAALEGVDQGTFPVTTFERVAAGRAFAAEFGTSIGPQLFAAGDRPARATKALARLAADVATGHVTSRDEFAKAETTLAYVQSLASQVDAAPAPAPAPTAPASSPPSAPAPSGSPSPAPPSGAPGGATPPPGPPAPAPAPAPPATARRARDTKYLLEKRELQSANSNRKCQEILDELRGKVELGKAPYACALLVRSLQELTAENYLITVAKEKSPNNKISRIHAATKHLRANPPTPVPADFHQILDRLDASADVYSELSSVAHDRDMVYSDAHVRSTWLNIRGGMAIMWNKIFLASL